MTRLQELEKQKTKLKKQMSKVYIKRDLVVKKYDLKYQHLRDREFKISGKIYAIYKIKQKTCKHKNQFRTSNSRDDASFKSYIHCKDCEGWIGHVNFDGSIDMMKEPL